jgi:hypothetical protein
MQDSANPGAVEAVASSVLFSVMLEAMEADDDNRPFALKWSSTFPDANDFTARDPAHPTAFARVYFQPSHPDPKRRWFWTASVTHPGDGP